MHFPNGRGVLSPEKDSLIGLDTSHRRGLLAVFILAGISLAVSTALFFHLTYKLVRWHYRHSRERRAGKAKQRRPTTHAPGVDLTLGLSPQHFQGGVQALGDEEDARNQSGARPGGENGDHPASNSPTRREPNQFVVLLYNLLLADIHQSMAFFLNVVWWKQDGVYVHTATCWAQGWFISTGDLAASLFIVSIAVHTYLTAIRGWKPSQKAIIINCVSIWVFDYLMVAIGIAATQNGAQGGGFYVRAVAWCWINEEYELIRLLTHYIFIFIALFATATMYIIIFLRLRRLSTCEQDSIASMPVKPTKPTTAFDAAAGPVAVGTFQGGYNSAFLIYPIIYVLCTSPLAIGRIATMAGNDIGISYFCAAGALISFNGALDTLLWSTTRRDVVFGDVGESDALGLNTFTFMRTPHERKYGNMVWVQGGGRATDSRGTRPSSDAVREADHAQSIWSRMFGRGGRLPLHSQDSGSSGSRLRSDKRPRTRDHRSISQETLHGGDRGPKEVLGGIQMDLVTSVVVEIDPDSRPGRRGTGLAVSPADFIERESRAAKQSHYDNGGPSNSTSATSTAVGRDPSSTRQSMEKEVLDFDIFNRV